MSSTPASGWHCVPRWISFPHASGETLPKLPSDKEQFMANLTKKAYFSKRTLQIVKNFDYTELPKIDQLIADFYVLDDSARSDLFEYITKPRGYRPSGFLYGYPNYKYPI
jgi:hypothetical protein